MKELYEQIGEIRGKQNLIVDQLKKIDGKLDNMIVEVNQIKGKASVWGALTAAITSVIISLGLKK